MKLSDKIAKIKPSPTLAVTQKALELKQKGVKILSLSVGEPDFDTPQNIKMAAIKAINDGKTKYTAVDGLPELKKAIIEKFKRENKLEYSLDEVTVSTGGKQVLYNLFQATLNDGDEVIIPAPYWVSYPDMVLLAGGNPVLVECPIESGYKLTPLQLSNTITEKTKWLIINSPNNPTGACYTKAELAALGEVLKQNPHVHVLTDDIYEHIIFDGLEFFNIANAVPELKNRTFIVNGVSKGYSMTGWRIGYGAGIKEIIKAMNKIQSQSTSNATSISQYATLEALNGTQDFIKPNSDEFQSKRDIVYKALNSIEGIDCPKPDGAFYVFPSVKKLLNSSTPNGIIIATCSDFAAYLLEQAEVAVVPGVAFGLKNHIRISTAASKEVLEEACSRIKKACNLLSRRK
jgi:aspartate aminotransferase